MLTEDELAGLVDRLRRRGCPVLLTLSVVGRVELTPAEPLDRRVAAAFNAHQRRTTERGPPARAGRRRVRRGEFGRLGAEVLVRASPWRLGAAHAELAAEWFTGWVAAAREQETELAAETEAYGRRRLAQAGPDSSPLTVDHADLLVLPRRSAGLPR